MTFMTARCPSRARRSRPPHLQKHITFLNNYKNNKIKHGIKKPQRNFTQLFYELIPAPYTTIAKMFAHFVENKKDPPLGRVFWQDVGYVASQSSMAVHNVNLAAIVLRNRFDRFI
ncbi:protein of unknown function [Trichlorobacter ammonificans]|uniref:Uncharacterized protein n=1 Tax=Trichlorobacter ammonificans TaxID=2916410 RepID=A0ABM9D9Z7_9BACT|nr:protein of unknown function [Trichlorobacter ammonificans]